MKTIRKNSKRFNEILNSATQIKIFNYNNTYDGFLMEDQKEARAYLKKILGMFPFAKLQELPEAWRDRGIYRVTVHSNEWYDFS